MAGGPAETQLRHLVKRDHQGYWGNHSIEAYNQAIWADRKTGTIQVYSVGDGMQAKAWGDIWQLGCASPDGIQEVQK